MLAVKYDMANKPFFILHILFGSATHFFSLSLQSSALFIIFHFPSPPFSDTSGNSVQIVHGGPTLNAHGQIATPLNTPNPLPFLNLNGTLPQTNKPLGSKVCRWVQNDGTVCGKAFSKLDSLRRHVNELHKGVRPYACNLCEKSYGRRDYLLSLIHI